MKYVKLTFQYIKNRHFPKLVLISIIPAIILALLNSFSNTARYFLRFSSANSSVFQDIYINSTSFSWQSMLRGITTVLLITLVVAFFINTIVRHMRTGRFSLAKVFSRINDSFLATLRLVIAAALCLFIYGLLNSMLIYFWGVITNHIVWLTLVLSIVSMTALFFVLLLIFSLLVLWVPTMVITGQPALSSLSSSIRAGRKNRLNNLIFPIALPLLPTFALVYIIGIFDIKFFTFVIDFIMSMILLLYYPVLSLVTYYDVMRMDREDLTAINQL